MANDQSILKGWGERSPLAGSGREVKGMEEVRGWGVEMLIEGKEGTALENER